jgi:hypothetical protein
VPKLKLKKNIQQVHKPSIRESATSLDKYGLPLVINDDEINAAMKQSSIRRMKYPKKSVSNNVKSNPNLT